jgi:hypothetical protein
LIDDRDGRHYYYDVNALSNFVADARNVIGFDPHERLVDYLLDRVAQGRSVSGPGAVRSHNGDAAARDTASSGAAPATRRRA